jgi:hypothetical protein
MWEPSPNELVGLNAESGVLQRRSDVSKPDRKSYDLSNAEDLFKGAAGSLAPAETLTYAEGTGKYKSPLEDRIS